MPLTRTLSVSVDCSWTAREGPLSYLTVISWLTYPGVCIIKMVGVGGALATCMEQIGYSIFDFVAKAVFDILIWAIASGKSDDEGSKT